MMPSVDFDPSRVCSGFLFRSDIPDKVVSLLAPTPDRSLPLSFQMKPQNRQSLFHPRRSPLMKLKTIRGPAQCSLGPYSKVAEKVLDRHSHKFFRQSNITCMVKHPLLPLVFLACEKSLLVISCWTQSVISEFTPKNARIIRDIRIDPAGSKVILLDANNDLVLVKINNFGRSINELCRICDKKIIDVIFICGGTQAVLLVSDGLLLLSLLTQKLVYLFKFDKKDHSGGWGGPRLWTQVQGVRYELVQEPSHPVRRFRFEFADQSESLESSLSDFWDPNALNSSKAEGSQTDLLFCKNPSFTDGTLIYDEVHSRLLILAESLRQVIFFDLKHSEGSPLERRHLELSHVLFFEDKAKLINYCLSADRMWLYVVSRNGFVYLVDLTRKLFLDRIKLDFEVNKNNKIIGICKFYEFLVIEDRFSKISLINF